MGRIYTGPIDGVTGIASDADFDILQIDASATGRSRAILHEVSVSTSLTAAAKIRLRWVRRSTAGTGTAVTAVANDEGNTDAADTVFTIMIATPGTIISGSQMRCYQWDQLGELLLLPTPETRILTAESGILCLNCQTSLGASPATFSGHVVFEEE